MIDNIKALGKKKAAKCDFFTSDDNLQHI